MEAVVQAIVQQGTAVIWITHHLEEATLCDRIIAMEQGRCVYDGVPAAFFYGKDKEETTADAGKEAQQPSPCEQLGLAPPFTVQTALLLKRKGLLQHATPLRPEQLVKEVALWQSN